MQLDRNALNKLLSLSDRQLEAVIKKLGTEYGLDLSQFQVKEGDLDGLRHAMRSASDEELGKIGLQLKNGGRGRERRG